MIQCERPGLLHHRHHATLRILFITLEFRAGAFSGNGVYAQSQVRALSEAGHRLYVISGKPDDYPSSCGGVWPSRSGS